MKKIEQQNKVVEFEKCISCGCETAEPRNKHVDLRKNYIEGAGQLCDACHSSIYHPSTNN